MTAKVSKSADKTMLFASQNRPFYKAKVPIWARKKGRFANRS